MIVVTGAAGFIGSCLVGKLNSSGYLDIVVVDDFSIGSKAPNLEGKVFSQSVHRDDFINWLGTNHKLVQFIFHIGARTDTTEFNVAVFNKLNLEYTKAVWNSCVEFGLPLVYASSGATYGNGESGYDDATNPSLLKPLNPYGKSKNDFDIWALSREKKPYFWAGLKFFNVYGPNEYHKGRMACVIFHAFNQIKKDKKVKLFRSHRPEYRDGMQLRDFVYVKDVTKVCMFLMTHRKNSGLYNLGTGKSRSFLDLTNATFKALNTEPAVEFIDIPADIRDRYQYFTEAVMDKLRNIGYKDEFYTLEDGITDYVTNYLSSNSYL